MADPRLSAYLDAARDCILDVGWRRTTLTEVARRAGVSRMTIYRAWPDMGSLLGDLMTREWVGIAAATRVAAVDTSTPHGIAAAALSTIRALRDNELFVRIVELDPDLLLPYLISRRGRSQEALVEILAAEIESGQASGAIRHGRRHPDRAVADTGRPRLRPLGTDHDGRRRGLRAAGRGVRPPDHPGPGAPVNAVVPPITPGLAGIPDEVDVVVVGLGITGAGVALDAVTRGLSVLAVDAHDLAFGTSRWSSKLVHGGLRYLAQGKLAIARESAVERGILMEVTAPHLVRALPMLTPLNDAMPRSRTAMTWAGLQAGDLLRRTSRTSTRTLPRPRRLNATETLSLAPSMRADTLRGGLLAWDGQLEDDARLVVTVARTAASYGAEVRTRARVTTATGTSVELRDELTGKTYAVRARAVVNATGVWAGDLDDQVRLRPSRGTHLVLRGSVVPHTRVAVMVPIPGSTSRFAMVLPQPDGTLYVGLTDEPVTGPVPDVPVPSEGEIEFLLDVIASAFTVPPTRDDVVGAFAGLRPLLEVDGTDATADLSRRHAILTSATGVTTVVGGKLTTYRRMAQDTLDALDDRLAAGPCRTASLPLLGAVPGRASTAPARLVRRFGSDADLVMATAREVTGLGDDELLAPASPEVPVTLAELVFAITDEGAHDVDDLLDRRTRVGLIAADRAAAEPLARRALELVAGHRSALEGRARHP